jgi:hypothetical protein
MSQEAYPVKLKEVHVINVSPLVDTVLNFVKPFLKEKIRNRVSPLLLNLTKINVILNLYRSA